jgi:rhodanese-related sulfurtransferase
MSVDVLKFAQDNMLLLGVAVASGGLLIWPSLRGGNSAETISSAEAVQLINREDAAVLDVRSAQEFSEGHILNARLLPLAELEARIGELERLKRKPVIVCCEKGARSSSAVALLRKAGHDKVMNLAGGLDAWRGAGLPVVKD